MTLSPHYALPISLQDNAGVQPAGKGQHNPIDLVAHLFIFPSMEPPQRAHSARLTGAADTCNRGMVLNGKGLPPQPERSEEHTSELQSLMRISYAVFCLKKKKNGKKAASKHKHHKTTH